MQNFSFWNPTQIIFGEGTIPQIGAETKNYGKKVMLVYGMSSIKKNGVYDQVVTSLKAAGLEIVEFSGVKPNPALTHLNKGIALAKREQVEVIVAVGGGSVLDESKAIAAGAKDDGNVWDFFEGTREPQSALPLLTVLTLAATGSEMNDGGVITNEETKQKFNIGSPHIFPKVSILDPKITCTVPMDYTAYGAVDAISHLIEGYFTTSDEWLPIQDGYVETVVRSVIESMDRLMLKSDNYQSRATLMWGATLALNGIALAGIGNCGFPNHMIEHSLSAIYDIPHGAGLAIVIPGWMKYASKKNPDKFAQFARNVFDVDAKSPEQAAAQGIDALQSWFKSIGCPVTLSDGKIPESDIDMLAENATMLGAKWGLEDYTKEEIVKVLSLCN